MVIKNKLEMPPKTAVTAPKAFEEILEMTELISAMTCSMPMLFVNPETID